MNTTAIEVKKTQPSTDDRSDHMPYFEAAADIYEDTDGISVWLDTNSVRNESQNGVFLGFYSDFCRVVVGLVRRRFLIAYFGAWPTLGRVR